MTTFLIEYKSPRRIAISKRTGKKGQSRKYIKRKPKETKRDLWDVLFILSFFHSSEARLCLSHLNPV